MQKDGVIYFECNLRKKQCQSAYHYKKQTNKQKKPNPIDCVYFPGCCASWFLLYSSIKVI